MLASRYSNNCSSIETVRMLLDHSDINVNLQNNNGFTASMLASKYSTEKTIRLLTIHTRINNPFMCCLFYYC
jgi:ankyrin repeat protein